ncbi:HesB/IscA family protein [Blattabacterium cuenoti]|uniref:HesB/IscA family protein n=1 Tax=Blattabacterium cuenoti TaxID=1653831 RepID=UPI00163BE166|nr:iron-sulfur cluster assembly accessory protein [Blattabacterium cuenoti]
MVFISENAKNKLINIMNRKGFSKDMSFIRFGIKNDGCSGMSYELSFDNKKREEDELFKDKEINILIKKNNIPYLKGATLEYSDDLNGKGFYFINPNAKHTCGCGKSFSS